MEQCEDSTLCSRQVGRWRQSKTTEVFWLSLGLINLVNKGGVIIIRLYPILLIVKTRLLFFVPPKEKKKSVAKNKNRAIKCYYHHNNSLFVTLYGQFRVATATSRTYCWKPEVFKIQKSNRYLTQSRLHSSYVMCFQCYGMVVLFIKPQNLQNDAWLLELETIKCSLIPKF